MPQTMMERAVTWVSRQAQKRVPYDPSNPYIEGPFAPVRDEITETRLTVTGTLPRALSGVFARIGPNPACVANPATHHWFLGDGMVHGVRLRDGEALWYRNRWIGTDRTQARLGRAAAPGPRHGIDAAVNTNIIGHAGGIFALVEGGVLPVALDGDFNTQRHGLFASPATRGFSAHPHRDPDTGELHAMCYDAMVHDRIDYVVIGADGSLRRDVPIPVRHGPMIHDCAVTARYVVVLDLPVTFSMGALLRGRAFPYSWNRKHQARVGLLPREGDAASIRWFDVDPCYGFHIANAYDCDDGSTVLDIVSYDHMFRTSRQGPESLTSHFERWTLDPASTAVKRSLHSDFRQEFPRIDERLTGKPYRYAYTVGLDVLAPHAEPLYRHDLATGAVARHDYGPHQLPAEAVFVPRHAEAAEDDGWLLAFVYDLPNDSSTLVILDAGNFEGEPAATIALPARVPLGFHGNWIADSGGL
jgi:carotenoid cleavage dioxygenase